MAGGTTQLENVLKLFLYTAASTDPTCAASAWCDPAPAMPQKGDYRTDSLLQIDREGFCGDYLGSCKIGIHVTEVQ